MKSTYTQHEYYLIEGDTTLNRLYISLLGFWPSPEQVPVFLFDIERAIAKLSANFTTLIDLTCCKPHPSHLAPLHIAAHRLLKEKKSLQAAQVYSDQQVGIQAAAAGMMGQVRFKQFDTATEAERALNKAAASHMLEEASMFFELAAL